MQLITKINLSLWEQEVRGSNPRTPTELVHPDSKTSKSKDLEVFLFLNHAP